MRTEPAGSDGAAGMLRHPMLRLAVPVVVAIGLVAVAWAMTGSRPLPADAGFPDDPPPLALPSDTPDTSTLAKAATALASGQLDTARAGFTDVVAQNRDDEAGQVGLILSRWRTTGPISVERDLRQLAKEYPESALVALHLGMVQALLEEPREANQSLQGAVELGRAAADPTSLRMAQIAEDLLNSDAFRGSMPVLVAPAEVPAADRATLRTLLAAVGAGDRTKATSIAKGIGRDDDAMLQIAAAAAAFDKSAPQPTLDRLATIARSSSTPAAAADRARMLGALARAWSGGSRSQSCVELRRAASDVADPATSRLAGPIAKELCATS